MSLRILLFILSFILIVGVLSWNRAVSETLRRLSNDGFLTISNCEVAEVQSELNAPRWILFLPMLFVLVDLLTPFF